jgi:carboxyl-terminal processing protease
MNKETKNLMKKTALWVLASLLGGFALIGTFTFTFFDSPVEVYRFLREYRLIRDMYYQPVTDEQLFGGASKGMMESLGDPHSTYLTGDDYKSFMEQTNGQYGGIGIVFGVGTDGHIYVLAVFDGTPAQEAGITAGARLLTVDGESVEGQDIRDVSTHLRGQAGTKVTLTLEQNGEQVTKELTRSDITMPTIISRMASSDIGYIHITSFASHTPDEFAKALDDLKKQGASKLIIDVRMNPGGLIDSCVAIANKLITKGPVISYQVKNQEPQTYEVDGVEKSLPMVVLIDKNSASASEILSGAIQDRKEGVIMGETSYGKGTVQTVIPSGDNAALKISVAQYLTASGRKIDKIGIKPDIPVEQTGTLFNMTSDSVIQKAIAYLDGETSE